MKTVKSPDSTSILAKNRDPGLEANIAVIASLSYHLSRLPLQEGLSLALDALLRVTRSEAAELFLREPVTGDIVLTAHRGPFRKAFFQLVRFRPGEGYPGIIAVKKEPIFTTQLKMDPRYLRTQVKDLGFRSYICVPLEVGDEIIGSLNLASRESRRDFPEYKRLLSWAASSIAMAIRLRFYEVEKLFETSLTRVTGEVDTNLDSILKDLLNNLATLSEAGTLAATLYDTKSNRLIGFAVKDEKEKNACTPELASMCPAMSKARVELCMKVKKEGEVPYRNVPYGQALRVCVPLIFDKQPLGVIQLGYKKLPQPPTRDVVLVASAASHTASLLIMNRHYMKEKENIISATRTWHGSELSEHDGESNFTVTDYGSLAHNAKINITGRVENKLGHVLTLHCMGPFQVFRDGELIPVHRFSRRKALTLLKILAIKRGLPVPADAIAEYLWPEQSPELTAHHLEVVVSALRHVVDCHNDGKSWQFIHKDSGSYRLELSSACRLDIEEYHQLLSRAKYLKTKGKDEEALVLYQKLDHIYRGDLLEDELYAEWCWMERETLRETHLDIIRQIAMALVQKRNLESAIQYYRKALRIDTLREELHRQLIHTLLKAGRRDEALRQYFYCRDILNSELGINPSDETEVLHKILLDQITL